MQKLVYWNELDKGGHFAAFEQPAQLLPKAEVALASAGAGRRRFALGLYSLLVACCLLAGVEVLAASPPTLSIAGESSLNGIFDPSLEFVPGANEGWLAYSAVFGDVLPWGPHVESRLARSTDQGASWSFETVVNASQAGTLSRIDGSSAVGVWNYEVPSLVHDPDDLGREWKLFAHKVFRRTEQNFSGEQNEPGYSWIVLRTASDPGGPWSAERALLSSGPLPPAPYDVVEFGINALDESGSLDALLVYSEPGAFYQNGVLYLSVTGLLVTGPDRIVLLASHDHGTSWDYLGTLLTNADAALLGYVSFDGSSIAEDAGQVFLSVTPESPGGPLHDGVLVFPFADLSTGSLLRSGGKPVVHNQLPAIPGLPLDRRGGQSDYSEGSLGGILQPSLDVNAYPEMFRIHVTGRRLALPSVPGMGRVGGLATLLLLGLAGGYCLARSRA